jgi:hypothetical protein
MLDVAVGKRVGFINAKTQQQEFGIVKSSNVRLSDGTVIVTITLDNKGEIKLPVAALQRTVYPSNDG